MSNPSEKPAGAGDPAAHGHGPAVERRRRSLAKAVTWRLVGSSDTLMLSYVVMAWLFPLLGLDAGVQQAKVLATASYIALAEIVTKLLLFYLHDRAWARVAWGTRHAARPSRREGARRSAVKTATWRILASLDTALLAYLFTGTLGAALAIGGLEFYTKLVLYFIHERVWLRIPFGLRR